jgi:hypothetical protein
MDTAYFDYKLSPIVISPINIASPSTFGKPVMAISQLIGEP